MKETVAANSDFLYGHMWLLAAYSELNRQREARAESAEVLRLSPHFSLEYYEKYARFKDRAVEERFRANMRKAGLK